MKRTLVYILVVLAYFFTTVSGQAFDKVGTTAAQFLQIGVGGRMTAMAGAGVAMVEGPEALYWNPSGILKSRHFALNVYHSYWIAGLRHQFIGITVPLGLNAAIGFHGVSLGGDEFEQTTLSFQEGNGVMVEYGDLVLGASYAHQLTDRFGVGGTLKIIHQKMFHETASTVALDLGTHLQTDLPGFYIGMAMTNLGGEMTLEGRDLLTGEQEDVETQYQVSPWPLPLTFQVGIGWRLWGTQHALRKNKDHGGILVLDGQHINEGLTRWRMGWEYDFRGILFLRLGRAFQHHTEKWSLGGGLRFPVAAYLFQLNLAYSDLGDLGAVQRISLQFSGR